MTLPEPLARTHARAFAGQGRGWTVAEFTALLDSPHTILAGDARGFALARVLADEAELLTIATDPGHRRKGLARAALGAVETEARARGAARLLLEVAEDNRAAIALYEAAGYRRIGRRAQYYRRESGRIDALLLAKPLAPDAAA